MSLESGVANNTKVTEYKVKDKEGNLHSERFVLDKDKNEVVSHTYNGKEVEKEAKNLEAPKRIPYNPGNGEFFIINKIDQMNNTLEKVLLQLTEMNYYLCKAHGDDSDKERIERLLSDG